MCHVDDSVILGAWLQETDHKDIEDQVSERWGLDLAHTGKVGHKSFFI